MRLVINLTLGLNCWVVHSCNHPLFWLFFCKRSSCRRTDWRKCRQRAPRGSALMMNPWGFRICLLQWLITLMWWQSFLPTLQLILSDFNESGHSVHSFLHKSPEVFVELVYFGKWYKCKIIKKGNLLYHCKCFSTIKLAIQTTVHPTTHMHIFILVRTFIDIMPQPANCPSHPTNGFRSWTSRNVHTSKKYLQMVVKWGFWFSICSKYNTCSLIKHAVKIQAH